MSPGPQLSYAVEYKDLLTLLRKEKYTWLMQCTYLTPILTTFSIFWVFQILFQHNLNQYIFLFINNWTYDFLFKLKESK